MLLNVFRYLFLNMFFEYFLKNNPIVLYPDKALILVTSLSQNQYNAEMGVVMLVAITD
jgi:hypothetical protein